MGLNFSTVSGSEYLKSQVFQCIQEKINAIILFQNPPLFGPFLKNPARFGRGFIRPLTFFSRPHFELCRRTFGQLATLVHRPSAWQNHEQNQPLVIQSNVITPIRSVSHPLSRYFSPVMYYLISLLLHI
jgi:hypothetical protein